MKLLVSGLGGGLDVVNALLLYYAAKEEGKEVVLGSSQPAPLWQLENHRPFADSGAWMTPESKVNYKPDSRYAEPLVSDLTDEEIIFFSRRYEGNKDLDRLKDAILTARKENELDHLLFIDGGGDCLILTEEDACENSQEKDPFKGGDAQVLYALRDIPSYLATVSVGLDIKEERFAHNIGLMRERGAYCGRVNLLTGEKDEYILDHILDFEGNFRRHYIETAHEVLVLSENDFDNPEKMKSHTGVVTYRAMTGNYGIKRTYVGWEGDVGGIPGVEVKPSHCWMYFFRADEIHKLKVELNK